jgi:hypothetical protein
MAVPVLFRIEERIGDEDRDLVPHLGRVNGVGEDQDVGHAGGILPIDA